MSTGDACPCGRAVPYADCCGALHRGMRQARTAEDLMRSRYSAFSRGEVDYLMRTLHPSKRRPEEPELEESVKALQWVGLTITDVVAGGEADQTGIVEFDARYRAGGVPGLLHERSRFVREDGAWFYLDGDVSAPGQPARAQGRNEMCACGSGKKFKRCCGAPGRANG